MKYQKSKMKAVYYMKSATELVVQFVSHSSLWFPFYILFVEIYVCMYIYTHTQTQRNRHNRLSS